MALDKSSVEEGRRIQQESETTFHFATRIFPEDLRNATYILYAFFREADEIVDTVDGADKETKTSRLETFRAVAKGEETTDDAVLSAFNDVRSEYGIDDNDIDAFIDSMLMDTEKTRYETYDELETYMDGSAAAVGRMMTTLMQPAAVEKALPHATALGNAFQLTNFIRDVREDYHDYGRIYLPQTTLDEFGVTETMIAEADCNNDVRNAIEYELERAEALYRKGVRGIQYLPSEGQLPVLTAAVLYSEHHRLIRERNCDVLSATPSLSTKRKVWLVAKTILHWQFTDDPVTVFRRVSCVPMD